MEPACILMLGKLCLLTALFSHGHVMKPTIATDDRPGALYTVAIPHFLLLYVLTCGCYLFYWSYRNWAFYKAHSGAAITPVIRGLLWPFFVLELFDKVQNALDRAQQPHRWYPESRALLIMLLVMLSVLLFTFPDRPLGMVCVYVAEAVLIAISGYLFMGAQRAINLLSGDTR